MGAEQSSARGAAASNSVPKKTDYYQLLGVDRTTTDEELVLGFRPIPFLLRANSLFPWQDQEGL